MLVRKEVLVAASVKKDLVMVEDLVAAMAAALVDMEEDTGQSDQTDEITHNNQHATSNNQHPTLTTWKHDPNACHRITHWTELGVLFPRVLVCFCSHH